MFIGSVRVRNFRALEDVRVDLAPMTLLIGENSTGKSSLLHALAFFFEGTPLSPADVCSRSPGGTVAVEVALEDLGDADREAFGALVDGSRCTLTRTWSEADGVRVRGVARQYPPFRQVREADGFRARHAAYNSLRDGLSLPAVRSQADLDAAMGQYERDHPDQCEPFEIDATSIAATALRTRLRFVHVPAVQDASREAHEGRNTLLGRILSALAEQRAGVASEVAAVQGELHRYEQRIGDAHRAGLAQIEARLSDQLREVLPDGRIELTPGPVTFQMPEPEVRLRGGEQEELTEMGLQGHGFQRSFLIATLQLIPRLETSEPGSFRLFLAIEEPELFQHPSRIRYLARVLDEVAVAGDRGVQVCLTTHSPYLVDGARYERLRLFRRGASGGPLRTAASATEDDVARRLGAAPAGVRAKLGRTMDIRFNEAFFARAVILTEGTSDAGALLGTADAMKIDLDREGMMLLSASGKPVMPVRVAILQALGVPVFVVFDADRGNIDAQRHNLEIQRVLGVSGPVAEPSDTRGERFVCFERTIEAHLEALYKGFAKECADRAKAIGFGNMLGFVASSDELHQLREGTLRSHASIRFAERSSVLDDLPGQLLVRRLIRAIECFIAEHEPRGFQRQYAWLVPAYFADMANALAEQHRVLKPGGYAVCVVGNSMLAGPALEVVAQEETRTRYPRWQLPIATDVIIAAIAKALHFEVLPSYAVRALYPRNVPKASSRESIVILRKPVASGR